MPALMTLRYPWFATLARTALWLCLALFLFSGAAGVSNTLQWPAEQPAPVPVIAPAAPINLLDVAEHLCLPNGMTAVGERCI